MPHHNVIEPRSAGHMAQTQRDIPYVYVQAQRQQPSAARILHGCSGVVKTKAWYGMAWFGRMVGNWR